MEKESPVIDKGSELIEKQREEFKQRIGAEKENSIDLCNVEFNSNGEKKKFDPETLDLFQPTFYELLDKDDKLKGIFVELVCPDCGGKKSFYDQLKEGRFGTPLMQKGVVESKEGNLHVSGAVLTPNSDLKRWLRNFSLYLDGLAEIHEKSSQYPEDEELQKAKLGCPYCKLERPKGK